LDLLVQPLVNELELTLFARPLHPELFQVLRQQSVEFQGNRIVARATPSGHVISWESAGLCLWQVLGPAQDELPQTGRLLSRFPSKCQGAYLNFAPGWRYELVIQVEKLANHHFEQFQDDLEADGRRKGLMVRFWPSEEPRASLPGLSYLCAEARPGCFAFSAFHTHPREAKVVKILSLIEQPGTAAPWGFGKNKPS
jgi:hypothetical protein